MLQQAGVAVNPMERPFLTRKAGEILFALMTGAAGVAVIVGANELDTGWTRSGPDAGYFPARIGYLLIAASALILIREALRREERAAVLDRNGALRIATFLCPLVLFVAIAPWAGIYLGAALYLTAALRLVGGVGMARTAPIAILAPAVLFIAFEYVFKTPLPKGPLGPLLGLP
jgi:hypothetical protein